MKSVTLVPLVLVLLGVIILTAFSTSFVFDRNLLAGLVIGSGLGMAIVLFVVKKGGPSTL